MRRIAVAVAFLLLTTACAGGSQGSIEPYPSYTSSPPTEPPVETTPTVPSTTTTEASTTTTVGPWTSLPDPIRPAAVLAPALGGPATIETMCLEVATGGQIEPSGEAASGLADVLDLLGVTVTPEGCEATFRLAATGNRTSELYSFGQTNRRCGTGLILTGESSLVIAGVTERTWTVDINTPPPATTETCPDESAELSRHDWDDDLVTAPLVEMFGEVAGYAEWIGFIDAHIEVDSRPPSTDDEVQWLTSWLVEQKPAALSKLGYMAQVEANEPALLPLTPYLIALLDSAQNCAWCSSPSDVEEAESIAVQLDFDLGHILNMILPTGIRHNGAPAQAWWEVWERQQGS